MALVAISNGLVLIVGSVPAGAVVLYNGLSTPSQTPAQQGWVYQATAFPPVPAAIATRLGTNLDTTGNVNNLAGYFRLLPSALNRRNGYTINFTVQINSEYHGTNTNRAGFSVLVMSDRTSGETQPYGIELAFWQTSIWAQNSSFTRGENVSFNTQAVYNYRLNVLGTRYRLFVDGSSTPILQGSLRQYTGYTPPPGYPNPYAIPRLIFLGDNTTSAKAKVTVNLVEAQ